MNKTKKKRSKIKCKGGGVGSSRAKRVEKEEESLKKGPLKKEVVFSVDNEYYSDVSRDSDEMVRFTKKDQYQAYLDEAEEINEDIKEKNEKGKKKKKKLMKLIDPEKYAERRQDETRRKQKERKKTNKTIRNRENPLYIAAAERRRRQDEFNKHIQEFMEKSV